VRPASRESRLIHSLATALGSNCPLSSPPIRLDWSNFCWQAGLRCKQRQLLTLGNLQQALDGLPPSVQRKIEQPPVNGHQQTRSCGPSQGCIGLRGPIRAQMNVLPQLVEGADLQHRQVKRPMNCSNPGKSFPQA